MNGRGMWKDRGREREIERGVSMSCQAAEPAADDASADMKYIDEKHDDESWTRCVRYFVPDKARSK